MDDVTAAELVKQIQMMKQTMEQIEKKQKETEQQRKETEQMMMQTIEKERTENEQQRKELRKENEQLRAQVTEMTTTCQDKAAAQVEESSTDDVDTESETQEPGTGENSDIMDESKDESEDEHVAGVDFSSPQTETAHTAGTRREFTVEAGRAYTYYGELLPLETFPAVLGKYSTTLEPKFDEILVFLLFMVCSINATILSPEEAEGVQRGDKKFAAPVISQFESDVEKYKSVLIHGTCQSGKTHELLMALVYPIIKLGLPVALVIRNNGARATESDVQKKEAINKYLGKPPQETDGMVPTVPTVPTLASCYKKLKALYPEVKHMGIEDENELKLYLFKEGFVVTQGTKKIPAKKKYIPVILANNDMVNRLEAWKEAVGAIGVGLDEADLVANTATGFGASDVFERIRKLASILFMTTATPQALIYGLLVGVIYQAITRANLIRVGDKETVEHLIVDPDDEENLKILHCSKAFKEKLKKKKAKNAKVDSEPLLGIIFGLVAVAFAFQQTFRTDVYENKRQDHFTYCDRIGVGRELAALVACQKASDNYEHANRVFCIVTHGGITAANTFDSKVHGTQQKMEIAINRDYFEKVVKPIWFTNGVVENEHYTTTVIDPESSSDGNGQKLKEINDQAEAIVWITTNAADHRVIRDWIAFVHEDYLRNIDQPDRSLRLARCPIFIMHFSGSISGREVSFRTTNNDGGLTSMSYYCKVIKYVYKDVDGNEIVLTDIDGRVIAREGKSASTAFQELCRLNRIESIANIERMKKSGKLPVFFAPEDVMAYARTCTQAVVECLVHGKKDDRGYSVDQPTQLARLKAHKEVNKESKKRKRGEPFCDINGANLKSRRILGEARSKATKNEDLNQITVQRKRKCKRNPPVTMTTSAVPPTAPNPPATTSAAMDISSTSTTDIVHGEVGPPPPMMRISKVITMSLHMEALFCTTSSEETSKEMCIVAAMILHVTCRLTTDTFRALVRGVVSPSTSSQIRTVVSSLEGKKIIVFVDDEHVALSDQFLKEFNAADSTFKAKYPEHDLRQYLPLVHQYHKAIFHNRPANLPAPPSMSATWMRGSNSAHSVFVEGVPKFSQMQKTLKRFYFATRNGTEGMVIGDLLSLAVDCGFSSKETGSHFWNQSRFLASAAGSRAWNYQPVVKNKTHCRLSDEFHYDVERSLFPGMLK